MIRRFVGAALGRPRETAVGVDEARDLVLAAAARLGVSARALDNAIWSYQSRVKGRQALGTKETLNG